VREREIGVFWTGVSLFSLRCSACVVGKKFEELKERRRLRLFCRDGNTGLIETNEKKRERTGSA
jgi:hypothetical protein